MLWKTKKSITITNPIKNCLDESERKPNEIRVDKASEFYNGSMKSLLQDNDIEMYLTYNEGKSVVAKKFIGTLKEKFCKYMTSIPKHGYTDKLNDILDE